MGGVLNYRRLPVATLIAVAVVMIAAHALAVSRTDQPAEDKNRAASAEQIGNSTVRTVVEPTSGTIPRTKKRDLRAKASAAGTTVPVGGDVYCVP